MQPDAAEAGVAGSWDADTVRLLSSMKYRAMCLGCGGCSGDLGAQVEALRWREGHCLANPLHTDVIIESHVVLPSGTVARFFQST